MVLGLDFFAALFKQSFLATDVNKVVESLTSFL